MAEPLVSVVIPTRDRAALLMRAIASVFAQTYANIELIVVDDGSRDETERLVREQYGTRLQYVRNDNPLGPPAARNRGAALARGAYLAFLDSDDQWLPAKVAAQVDVAESGVDVVYCSADFISPAGDILFRHRAGHRGDVTRALLGDNVIAGSTSAVLVRRSCFEAVGGFRTGIVSEDWDLWLRLAFRFIFDFVPDVLVRMQVHPDSVHRSLAPAELARSLESIFNETAGDQACAPFMQRHRRVWRSAIEYHAGTQHKHFGETAAARRRFLRSIAARPFQFRAYRALALLALGRPVTERLKAFRSIISPQRFGPKRPTT